MGPDGFPVIVVPDRLTDIAQLIKALPEDDVDLIGGGALRYRKRLLESRIGRCDPDGSRRHRLQASAVGLIGIHRYSQGLSENPLTFCPKYFRLFEAEAGGAI